MRSIAFCNICCLDLRVVLLNSNIRFFSRRSREDSVELEMKLLLLYMDAGTLPQISQGVPRNGNRYI